MNLNKIDGGEVTIKYCPTNHMWSDILTKLLQGHQFRLIRAMLMNCPIDHDEISEDKESKDWMMRNENKSIGLSQGCVEQNTQMAPTILRCKDRQKIQGTGKIQDANDVVVKMDTGGIANEDTLLLTKKVRWKDMEK